MPKVKREIGGPSVVFTTDDIADLRRRIRVGDVLRYPVMKPDKRTGHLFVSRYSNEEVTGVYPHLVTVSGPVRPVRTITYIEMLTMPAILRRI